MVRPAALAAHASNGGTLFHTDRQHHGGPNAPTHKGVRGLEPRVESRLRSDIRAQQGGCQITLYFNLT